MSTQTNPADVVVETSNIRKNPLRRFASSGSSPKNGVKSMLKRSLSFSGLKLKKKSALQRSLTPMKLRPRRDSSTSESLTSLCSSSGDFASTVRFTEGRSKKINTEVFEFEKHSVDEVPKIWYTEEDMGEIMEDVKVTVKHYCRNCNRYRFAMEKISRKCATAPDTVTGEDSLTQEFDPRVLEQLSNAAARGLEHHIAPRMCDTRKEIVREIIATQDGLKYCKSQAQKEEMLAEKYTRLTRTAKLMAKTMADGDAMVAQTMTAEDKKESTTLAAVSA